MKNSSYSTENQDGKTGEYREFDAKSRQGGSPLETSEPREPRVFRSRMGTRAGRRIDHPRLGALEILKYIGPGFLVTIGFIDPGNWASNIAGGLGVRLFPNLGRDPRDPHARCSSSTTPPTSASRRATASPKPRLSTSSGGSVPILGSAVAAAVSTALAEVLGAAIALNMLTGLPIQARRTPGLPSSASSCCSRTPIESSRNGSSASYR